MICSNCGKEFQGNFCPMCGSKAVETPVSPVESVEPVAPTTPVEPVAPVVPTAPVGSFYPPAPVPEKPKKKGAPKRVIAFSVIAVILAIVVAVSGMSISVFAQPSVKLGSAVKKTFIDAGGFSFDFETVIESTYTSEYYDPYYYGTSTSKQENKTSVTAEGAVALGDDLISTSIYADVTVKQQSKSNNDGEVTNYDSLSSVTLVSDGGKAIGYMKYDGEKTPAVSINTKDAYSYILNNKEDIAEYFGTDYDDFEAELKKYYNLDVDTITNWIDNIVKGGKINDETLADIYDGFLKSLAADELDIDESDIPSYKELSNALTEFLVKGVSDDSIVMEKTDSKDGIKYYDVTVNVADLLRDLKNYLRDCKELEAFFDTTFGEELMDALKNAIDEADDEKIKISFKAGLKNGYIVYLETKNDNSYEDSDYSYSSKTVTKLSLSEFKEKFDFSAKYDEVAALFKKDEIIEIKTLEDLDEVSESIY